MPNKFTYLNQINLSVYNVYTCIQYPPEFLNLVSAVTLYRPLTSSVVFYISNKDWSVRTEGRSDCSDRIGKRHKFSVFLVLCFTRCFVAGSRFKMADLDKGGD